jgi:hypothetical protein
LRYGEVNKNQSHKEGKNFERMKERKYTHTWLLWLLTWKGKFTKFLTIFTHIRALNGSRVERYIGPFWYTLSIGLHLGRLELAYLLRKVKSCS